MWQWWGTPHPSSIMLVHYWNVRGLNNPLKQYEVVNLMKKNKVDVCGLVETKLTSSPLLMESFAYNHVSSSAQFPTRLKLPQLGRDHIVVSP